MPRNSKDGQPFDQIKYINQWSKENMASVSAKYKKEFVQEFKASCAKLDLKQSDVFRNAMQAVIEQANEQESE